MATVTGLTADRMLAIEAASVVDGDVVGDNLILTKHDGSQINAGSVRGPQGSQGPVGSMLAVLAAKTVQEPGLTNQIRAGRQLSPADFGAMGLNVPVAIYNLSDLTDVSGNGRNLSNKGAVTFASGINGGANTAAQFIGATGQALYLPDTGVNDPFKIKTGSYGCWFRQSAPAITGSLFGKESDPSRAYRFDIGGTGAFVQAVVSPNGASGTEVVCRSVSSVCDDRWHFVVATVDGAFIRLYVDGVLETATVFQATLFSSTGPFVIGGIFADGSTATTLPYTGRIDEVFVTADVLDEDEIRNLYCAKIPHTLAAVPSRVSVNVRRCRRGAALAVADFPTQPLRLHNFSAGSLADEGSNAVNLTSDPGVLSVSGVDGSAKNAFSFPGALTLYATDAGLPSGIAPRSYGCWFKTTSFSSFMGIMGWGTVGTGDARVSVTTSGTIRCASGADFFDGPFIADGQWHFVTVLEDNGAVDNIRRKLYIDGKLVGTSTAVTSIALVGATRFRIASAPDSTIPFIGQIDGVFICGYILTPDQISTLYAKSLIALTGSPKNSGDHIEAMDANNLYAIFDTIEAQHQIDLAVA